jgi:hypothetical protein
MGLLVGAFPADVGERYIHFSFELCDVSMDKITIKTPNPKMSSLLVFNRVYRLEIVVFSTRCGRGMC